MENEMIALPIVWALIGGTALLTSFVSATLPSWPKYWSAFINAIKRVFTWRATTPKSEMDMVDVIIIAKLEERIDDLEQQIHNIAERQATQQRNRKYNIRRDVREYLDELRK